MKPFSLTIGGRRWRVEEGNPGKDQLGHCDAERRRIRVRKGGTVAEQVGVMVHEVLHAAYWDLDEEAIERGELAIVTALAKAGLLAEDD